MAIKAREAALRMIVQQELEDLRETARSIDDGDQADGLTDALRSNAQRLQDALDFHRGQCDE